jgi:hypothetical protein
MIRLDKRPGYGGIHGTLLATTGSLDAHTSSGFNTYQSQPVHVNPAVRGSFTFEADGQFGLVLMVHWNLIRSLKLAFSTRKRERS